MQSRGADINMKSTFEEWTALHYAASAGSLKCVDYLVQYGAFVDVKTNEENCGTYNGWAPIHFAADAGHLDVVQYLVEVAKAIIDQPTSEPAETALALAAEHGRFDVVRYLVAAGANIHCKRRGMNVVQWCIYRCSFDTVQFLVSYGAKPDLESRVVWFGNDDTLEERIRKEWSPPLWEKVDTAIYRGSVQLRERAAHMRLLSEVSWEGDGGYDPYAGDEGGATKDVKCFPRHIVHIISSYEI
mmetsp:Transcript_13195/g.25629  ORF Transcript_13195/g.25629 Transcript_13195/m.25629 type:complete len:243 (+) Transcript_13195:139-867(+)